MKWITSTDATTERNTLRNRSSIPQSSAPATDPYLSASLAKIQQEAGWLSPDTKLALAKGGASQQAIDKAAELGARRLVDRNDPLAEDGGQSFWYRKIYPKIKAASRWTQAALDFIPETAQGAVAQLFDDNKDIDGWFISTKLGTMFEDADKAGEGWFVGGEANEKQAERARRYRGTINGSAWTLGRAAANRIFLPNSKPYNIMSGVIDAAVLVRLDPTAPVTKAIGVLRREGIMIGGKALTRGFVVPIQSADEAAELSLALRGEAGLQGTDVLDRSRWLSFMNQNRRARALVDRIWSNSLKNVDEVDDLTRQTALADSAREFDEAETAWKDTLERFNAGEITREEADEAFGAFSAAQKRRQVAVGEVGESADEVIARKTTAIVDLFTDTKTGKLRVSTETIDALLNAGSKNEVLASLSPQWVAKSGSLPEDIRAMQGIFGTFVDRIPLTSIRKSRFFTQVPGSKLVVGGNDLDNREAIVTVRNWAQTIGMDKAVQDKLLVNALKVFRGDAVRSDQNSFIDFFFGAMSDVLVKNGVDKNFVDLMREDGKRFADLLRLYYIDNAGKPTDGNFWNWLKNSNLAEDPDQVQKMLLDAVDPNSKLRVDSPLVMVDMLNRAVYLPDAREIRRLTRSRLMRQIVNTTTRGDREKLSAKLFTKASKEVSEVRPNQVKLDEARSALAELGEEQRKLQQTRFLDQTTPEYKQAQTRLAELDNQQKELANIISDIEKEGFVNVETVMRRGRLRWPLGLAEWYQQSFWKPLALATGGYVMRNTIDAQIRMALSGFSSIMNHPFKYIALVTGRNSRGSLIGEDLLPRIVLPDGTIKKDGFAGVVQKIRYGKYEHSQLDPQIIEELSFGMRKQGFYEKAEDRMWESNNWVPMSVQQNRRAWFRGIGQNGTAINKDAALQAAARTFHSARASGAADLRAVRARAAAAVVTVVKNDETYYESLRKAFENGLVIRDERGNSFVWKSVPWAEASPQDIDDLLQQWAYRTVVDRVQMMSGNQAGMEFMLSYNAVPKRVKGEIVPTVNRPIGVVGDRKIGETFQLGEGSWGVVVGYVDEQGGIIDEATGELALMRKQAIIQPVVSTSLEEVAKGNDNVIQAFINRDLSFAGRSIVEDMPVNIDGKTPGIPSTVKYELIEYDETDPGQLANVQEGMDKMTDWFFGRLYASVTTMLDRSPVFRQAYYQSVSTHLDSISAEAARKLVKTVEDGAKQYNMKPQAYVGDKDLWKRIQLKAKTGDEIANPLTLEELDDYAKWVALDEVKGLLYNAASRNNLEDSLRIVAPFAVAWREILGTYAQFLATNPANTYRQFQRVYTGLEGADPENDGRGFIYKDPVTNQTMFKFPMSGVLARALTGINAELEAPVSQLSQGISVIPALGPYGQLAVSQLPDQPQYDDIIEFLLPYGRTEQGNVVFNATPGWVRKALETLQADPKDQASLFYNTYIETVRAKAASGAYDLGNPADKQRLLDDSRRAARVLMAMRTASQFFGPTAATAEFQVPTKEGDQYVSLLIAEFYKMQAEDYDTAIPRFLEEFGDEAFVYAAGKTRSLREGLEATAEFGDWERQNQNLLGEYPDVAAYLAPAGSDFSFAVWQRQLMSGEREKLSDRELLTLAQERVGAAKYRAMRLKAGPYPNDEVKGLLRQYRESLAKQYPGFPAVAQFEVGKFEAQIVELTNMVSDERTQNNPIAEAVRTYLGYREALLLKAREAGYVANTLKQTKGLDSFRDLLASIGNQLIQETPEFARIYDRLLSQEVEL